MSGSNGTERIPDAATTNGVTICSLRSVSRCHCAASSSKVIATTPLSNRMSRRRSNRSATKLRYASISGWAGIVSVHTHSCWISSEKLYEYSMLSMSQRAPGYLLNNQVPPTAAAFSSTQVRSPRSRSSCSMYSPEKPAPMITASYRLSNAGSSSTMCDTLLKGLQ